MLVYRIVWFIAVDLVYGLLKWIAFKLLVVKVDLTNLEEKPSYVKVLYVLYFYTIGILVRLLKGIFCAIKVGFKAFLRTFLSGFKVLGAAINLGLTIFFSKYMLAYARYVEYYKNQEIPEVLEPKIEVEGNLVKKILLFFRYFRVNTLLPALRRSKIKRMQQSKRRIEKYEAWGEKETSTFLINNAIYIVIAAMILTIIIIKPTFVKISVFKNILTQSSVRMILAFGVGGIIILQGTDLSLGRSVGFAAMISASLLQSTEYGSRFYEGLPQLPLILPLIIAMIVSGFFSAINGFVVAKFKVHPFLATLGASVALYGLLSMYFASGDAGAQPIGGLSDTYTNFSIGNYSLFGMEIPHLIVYAGIIAIVVWVIWNKTTFGKNMFAVGGNPEAANISGVSVMKTTVLVYIMAGLLYGMGGFLEAARIGSVSNGTGFNYELDAIAACVVGGISFSGGIGKVSGAITGVLMFTIITYGMNFIGLPVFYQYIVKGIIIVVAVALDTRKYIIKT
jgi:methyl-galactoside transport system permease protein